MSWQALDHRALRAHAATMRVSRFALCSLGVATALRPQTSSFARRAARAASTAEDCGCEVTYGGDVPASAKTMDHLAAVRDVEAFDAATGGATTLGAKLGGDRVAVVSFLRSFG